MRIMDGCAITEFGIENRKFAVFCGVGNNGGDGLVVARKLLSNGGNVKVIIIGDPLKSTGNMAITEKLCLLPDRPTILNQPLCL